MRLQSISTQISKSSVISVYVLMPTPEGREACAIMTRASEQEVAAASPRSMARLHRPRHHPEGDHFHFSQRIFILSREGLARQASR